MTMEPETIAKDTKHRIDEGGETNTTRHRCSSVESKEHLPSVYSEERGWKVFFGHKRPHSGVAFKENSNYTN